MDQHARATRQRIFMGLIALCAALSLSACSDSNRGATDSADATAVADVLSDAANDSSSSDVAVDTVADINGNQKSDADDAAAADGDADAADDSDADASDAADSTGPTCTPASPPDEVCNGVDDDCDGLTDEGADLCDDDNVCTLNDACTAAKDTAACTFTPTAGPCDDGDICTGGETCVTGTCEGGFISACDDQNDCTLDNCDSSGAGCVHEVIPNCGIDCNVDKPACPKPLWCQTYEPLSCGGAGRCIVSPDKCDLKEAAVCGCDGKNYDGVCAASQAKMNVQANSVCKP
jgi:hypothetical protein